MIHISEAPADLQHLEAGYPAAGTERTLLQSMMDSPKTFDYDTEEELKFEVELRAATVKAAIELDHSGMAFAVFRKARCNPAYWNRTDEGGFLLKEGVDACDAVRNIYEEGEKYATECATAILIVQYKAVLSVYPDALFNQVFPKIQLMNWHYVEPVFRGVGLMTNTTVYFPGDRQYFMNPDVNPLTPEWQGENVILLEGDRYYGHGVGIHNADAIIHDLNGNRVHDPKESAYLLQMAGRPDYSKLWKYKKEFTR